MTYFFVLFIYYAFIYSFCQCLEIWLITPNFSPLIDKSILTLSLKLFLVMIAI